MSAFCSLERPVLPPQMETTSMESGMPQSVVIYQAMYGAGQIWVRPYDIFFSKVTLPDGTEVERFKEITL